MNSMKFYEQDKYFMEKMKYLNKGRNKNNKNKNNNFQTCRTVRDSLTVKNCNFWHYGKTCDFLFVQIKRTLMKISLSQ